MTTTLKRTMITLRDWRAWVFGGLRSVIEGTASAGLTWLGTAAGSAIDPELIRALDWKQFLAVLGFSAGVRLMMYLSTKPLPDGSEIEEPAAAATP